jgi:hypothetical protein
MIFNDQCDKTIVRGTMEAGKNSVICMGLIVGPNKTDKICWKTMVTGTMHQGSTVYTFINTNRSDYDKDYKDQN